MSMRLEKKRHSGVGATIVFSNEYGRYVGSLIFNEEHD